MLTSVNAEMMTTTTTTTTASFADNELDPVSVSMAVLGVLLLTGHLVREYGKCFQTLHMPASLLAGLIGMAGLQILKAVDSDAHETFTTVYLTGWKQLPGQLTTILFAGLVLGKPVASPVVVWEKAGAHLLYGLSVVFGQYLVCALVTGAFLMPVFDTNQLWAPVIPLGFEGGHGVVAGVQGSFDKYDYSEGYDVGLAAASLGIVIGVLFGSFCVNWCAARGLLVGLSQVAFALGPIPADTIIELPPAGDSVVGSIAAEPEAQMQHRRSNASNASRTSRRGSWASVGPAQERRKSFTVQERPTAGDQVVPAESLDSLAYHLCLVAVCIGIGVAAKAGIAGAILAISGSDPLANFPLFPFCLMSSLFAQVVLFPLLRLPVDGPTIERILNTTQDFMITSAMALLNFDEIVNQGGPFIITCVSSMLWSTLAFFVVAPAVLPDFWAERALVELGISLGSTATGLLLLRMADPENKTPVFEQFGYKQVVHCMIVGGGIVDALSLAITCGAYDAETQKCAQGHIWVLVAFSAVCLVLCVGGLLIKNRFCVAQSIRASLTLT